MLLVNRRKGKEPTLGSTFSTVPELNAGAARKNRPPAHSSDRHKSLNEGRAVEFEVIKGTKDLQAVDITPL